MQIIKYIQSHPPADQWAVANLRVSYRITGTPVAIRDADDAARILHRMWDQSLINIQEQTAALYLNSKNQAIGYRLISSGKLSSAVVDKSLLLSCALLIRATGIIIAHNHPSGDLTPSKADIRSTCQLQKAINLIDCRLVDHLILSDHAWYSMADGNNFIPDL